MCRIAPRVVSPPPPTNTEIIDTISVSEQIATVDLGPAQAGR